MPYWDEYPYKVVTSFPLSSDIIKIMYTNSDVIDKLSNNEDPIQLSINKWDKILQVYKIISELRHPYSHYDEIYDFIDYKTCALCIVSIKNYVKIYGEQKFREDKCKVCPLSKIERCIDETSTYNKITSILKHSFSFGDDLSKINRYKQDHEKLGELINNFIDLLKNLKQ